jgi:hypothetical protein
MTQRERPASQTARPHAPDDLPGGRGGLNLAGLLWSAGAASLWEQWYEQASEAQRHEALAHARDQGLLFCHQLPAPEAAASAGPRRSLLTALLHGPAPELPPVAGSPFAPIDGELDEWQRQAAARGLSSPDLSLVLGGPGSGKSRVVAEVLRQCAARGQRVLFLSPTPAGLDRVLGSFGTEGTEGGPAVVRRLSAGESWQSLPEGAARFTIEHRLHAFTSGAVASAARAARAAGEALEQARHAGAAWPRCEELAARLWQLREQSAALESGRAGLAAALEAELEGGVEQPLGRAWDAAQRAWQDARAHTEAQLRDIRAALEELQAREKQCDAERTGLAPLAEAKQAGRWWTGAYWRGTLKGGGLERLEQLQAEAQQVARRREELSAKEQDLAAAREQGEADLALQRKTLLAEEFARRDAQLAAELAGLAGQVSQAGRTWQELYAALAGAAPAEGASPREATAAARQMADARLRQAEHDLAARQGWLQALERAAPALPGRLAAAAAVVATTPAALPADPLFGDQAAGAPFDLLVLDEAHRLGDAELLAVSRRARRWMLVGEPPADLTPPAAPAARRNSPARGRPAPARPELGQARPAFGRLWNLLHPDPRRLPVRWRVLGDRLVASLQPVAAEQEAWVQHEPVFDRPEIELSIVSPPRQDPKIAEVSFPAGTPIEQAKQFLIGELQELSVESPSPALLWAENDRAVKLHLGPADDQAGVSVPLGQGVHELVGRPSGPAEREAPWQTTALVFDRPAGWDRARAEQWAAGRLGLRDCGRTTVLARSHRARGPLACFLADVLRGGFCCAAAPARPGFPGDLPAVELVAVPALGRGESRRGDEPEPRWSGGGTATLPRVRPVKGGAGLEIDLADPHRLDGLPAELRAGLPAQGVVNLAEARAVVESLEALAGDASFAELCRARPGLAGPHAAVISPFPAQVELLRRLVERSAVLSAGAFRVEAGLPAAFHQREAPVVLLSLTRSHVSRAVPFSDSPRSLLTALTRATDRLVLFGDPGTMARRTQWHGGLDHLDEAAGPVEQALLGRLLACLADPNFAPPVGRSRESSSV